MATRLARVAVLGLVDVLPYYRGRAGAALPIWLGSACFALTALIMRRRLGDAGRAEIRESANAMLALIALRTAPHAWSIASCRFDAQLWVPDSSALLAAALAAP